MLDFLADLGVPTIVVVTKTDKLTAKERARRVADLSAALGLDADQVIAFSAVTGAGRDELAEAIDGLLAQPAWRSEA
jgi:GTP-binding protein